MMEKAMDYLEKLSAKADVRLLAERREMAHLMYQMELNLAREEGEAKGIVQGKRDVLLMLLEKNGSTLTDEHRRVAASCDDLTRLDQWLRRAIAGERIEDILG